MKNFTNNFKQFTSRLSARWLIMALTLLLGTSSAWATVYLKGSWSWNEGIAIGDGGGFCSVTLNGNTTYWFYINNYYGNQDHNHKANGGTMTSTDCTDWWFNGDQDCAIETTITGTYTFKYYWKDGVPVVSVEYPEEEACTIEDDSKIRIELETGGSYTYLYAWYKNDNNVEIHPLGDWPGSSEFTEKQSLLNSDNVKYIEISRPNNTSADKKVSIIFNNNKGTQTGDITNLSFGKVYRYNNDGTLDKSDCLPKDCTTADFSVNTLSDLAVGCTATASITGDDVAVTWSSLETSVASIDPNTGVITANAAGETTISATTTDANGFCSGTQKTTTLTVKNPSVTVGANRTTLCAEEELTLTATVTDAGTGNTYQWYKGDYSISGAISEAYTISSVSTTDAGDYKVVVNGGILCSSLTSEAKTITVNAIPNAPTFTTNSAQVCSGVAFNLNEKFTRNTGEAGNLTWYKSSDDSQVTDPASVTITEATSYYAKATNNNCTSGKSLNCTVNVDTKPTLELASTPTVCPNVEIDLDDYATYNTGTLTWYSNQERTTVITNGLVTPTERTTYYATVINGTCNPVENEFTVDVYGIADDMPAYTSTPATSCKETPNSDGTITLKNPMGGVTYTLDDAEGESNVWTGLSAGTHTLSALVDACPSLTREWDIEVGEEDITPSATVTISGEASFCEGTSTELTCVVNATKGNPTAYQWYNGDNLIQGATESTYTAKAAGSYKVVVTVENKGCKDTFNATKEVSVKNKPTTPEFNPDFTSICVGGSTTLASGYNWYTELNASALVDLTVSPQTTTTYYATKVENGCTSDAGEFTVTINPLPAITAISVNNSSPVINEDVLLTVEGSDIARVEWSITSGTASLSDASGNSVKLTSTASGAVNVTATAISINGCRATSTKEVTFKAVDECEPNVTTHTTKTKIRAKMKEGQTSWNVFKIYSYGVTDSDSNGWPGAEMDLGTGEDEGYYVYTFEDATADFNIILNNGNSGGENQTVSGAAKAGKIYTFEVGAKTCSQDNDTRRCLESSNVDFTTTSDPELSAPAVKTVSATSEEGSGIVTFTGKIVKTGCAAKSSIHYGYQFKKVDEEWPTSGIEASNTPEAGKLIPCTNASATALNYQFSANVEGLENGNYHFRAYIINGYNFTNGNYDQGVYYGLDKLVTVSTTKTPISNVTLDYCNEEGKDIDDPNPMCKGATAYVKLEYAGSTYSDIKWLVEGVETNLVTDEGDGVWSYEIQGDGSLSVELKNDVNTDPAWPYSNKLPFSIIPEPTAPYISIDPASGVICEGFSATIKVENPSTACSYKLVEEEEDPEAEFVEYESGDLKYSVGSVGKYYVAAKHKLCPTNEYTSNQVAINQIISTNANISIEPANAETTPWEPVSITVTADEGYVYEVTYTGNNLQDVEGVIIKQKGDTYTYYIPRPTGWGEGNAVSVRTPVSYDIKAQLKVDGEANQCDLSFDTATITVKDEENEDCD